MPPRRYSDVELRLRGRVLMKNFRLLVLRALLILLWDVKQRHWPQYLQNGDLREILLLELDIQGYKLENRE